MINSDTRATSNLDDVISRIFYIAQKRKIILKKREIVVRPMKLQKLLFFAYGWYAGTAGKRLFKEEFEAWPYGPVIPEVYRQYKKYGAGEITEHGEKRDLGDPTAHLMVDDAVREYGIASDIGLSNITHEKGSPWDQVWKSSDGSLRHREVISFEIIRDFYQIKAREPA